MKPEAYVQIVNAKVDVIAQGLVAEMEKAARVASEAEIPSGVQPSPQGYRAERVFEATFEAATAGARRMVDACLGVDSGRHRTDEQIASGVRSQVEPRMRTALENNAWGKQNWGDRWGTMVSEAIYSAALFRTLQQQVQSARYDRDSKEELADKIVKRWKNHRLAGPAIAAAIVLTFFFGLLKAGQEVASWFQPAPVAVTQKVAVAP